MSVCERDSHAANMSPRNVVSRMSIVDVELVYDEDHTLGQILQHYLSSELFAATRVPHPAQQQVNLKLSVKCDSHETRDNDVHACIMRAQARAIADLDALEQAVEDSLRGALSPSVKGEAPA